LPSVTLYGSAVQLCLIARRRYVEEVIGGCMFCGAIVLTDRYPLRPKACDACKAAHRAANNRKGAERRKAARHALKRAQDPPQCLHCGKLIKGAVRFAAGSDDALWARKYCGNACRQAAFRKTSSS
jgi:hypothetical protein